MAAPLKPLTKTKPVPDNAFKPVPLRPSSYGANQASREVNTTTVPPGGVDPAAPQPDPVPALASIGANKVAAASVPSTAVQLAEQFRKSVGSAPTVTAPSITNQLSQLKPTTITGLSDDYFNSQKELLKQQLRDEFFGQGAQWDNAVASESAAGRLGSGVARGMLQKTVTEPFIKASTAIDSQIFQAVMTERARVENYNADQFSKYNDLLARAAEVDSTNKLTADQATATLRSEYDRLSATLADAEGGRLSTEAIAQLEADVKVFQSVIEDKRRADALNIEQEKNRMEDFRTMQENQLDFLSTPMKSSNQSIGQQTISEELYQSFNPSKASTAKVNSVEFQPAFPKQPTNGMIYTEGGKRYIFIADPNVKPQVDGSTPTKLPGKWVNI